MLETDQVTNFAVTRFNMGDAPDEFYAWFFDTDTSVKVISTGYPDSNTMVVYGGEWFADA